MVVSISERHDVKHHKMRTPFSVSRLPDPLFTNTYRTIPEHNEHVDPYCGYTVSQRVLVWLPLTYFLPQRTNVSVCGVFIACMSLSVYLQTDCSI